jgi:hypothetical protein
MKLIKKFIKNHILTLVRFFSESVSLEIKNLIKYQGNKSTEEMIHKEDLKILLSKNIILQLKSANNQNLPDWEFKVFSQWGQDGIIQFLLNKLNATSKKFIEFGVENYIESNTRFLLMNNNWSGLIIDGSEKNISEVNSSYYIWKYDLKTVHSFITKDNINSIIKDNNFEDADLLSIDLDGNDYWIWDSILIKPLIVIIEFNSIFGSDKKISVPYKENFQRNQEHYSNLYFGASLPALKDLGEKKGYDLIYVNQERNDAFFVLNGMHDFIPFDVRNITESKSREGRDEFGNLTLISGRSRYDAIRGLPIFNFENQKVELL